MIGEYFGMVQGDRRLFWNGPGAQGYILEWTRGAGGYFGMDLHGHVSPAPGHLPALALALVHSRGAPSPETQILDFLIEDKNSRSACNLSFRLMLLMEELRFILDCFQFELARETMDKVLSFSLLDGKQ